MATRPASGVWTDGYVLGTAPGAPKTRARTAVNFTTNRTTRLRRFSNPLAVLSGAPGGVFLRKTPLRVRGSALHQLENRYKAPFRPAAICRSGCSTIWRSLSTPVLPGHANPRGGSDGDRAARERNGFKSSRAAGRPKSRFRACLYSDNSAAAALGAGCALLRYGRPATMAEALFWRC